MLMSSHVRMLWILIDYVLRRMEIGFQVFNGLVLLYIDGFTFLLFSSFYEMFYVGN